MGKRLKHLTKHPRKKIQSFASDLIEILWKNIILEETTQKKIGNSSAIGSVKAEPVNVSSTNKAILVKVEKSSHGENGKVEQGSPRPQKLAKTEKRVQQSPLRLREH